MSSLQALYCYFNGCVCLVAFSLLIVESGCNVNAAGTSYDELAFLFGVEVEQNLALKFASGQSVCSVHACFLVGCYQCLDRSVLQVFSLHDSHDGSHAQTVVGSESCAFSPYPFAVDVSLYRVSLKVMSTCLFFLWNHVHVCLQNHRLAVFHAGCGGLAHNDVASLVFKCFNACVFCEVEQELLNFLQMS